MICLFQSDATYNKFLGTVMTMNEKPIISGKVISILKEQDSINNKWADSGAKYVVWHTGFFTTKEKAVASRNYNSDSYSSIFDGGAGIALKDYVVMLIYWYDKECDYSNRMVDFTVQMASMEQNALNNLPQ
ncbi:Glyceraldehyde-3-phosphate dehydrogenase [Cricetulus griseus]|uniref:glyceraldehyde-3-phosphate dehydrogenase (phosphorylating) n=1 Tax=Cricetulus griseus TaxID=10029 RepID=G3HG12_CRIGR|nr:Glyceraldehyde-3-phosphate dehydrogenase [Cricetulus griseus]